MDVICENADKCFNADCCNHGSLHELWNGCIVGKCYHFSKNGDNACLKPLEEF